MNIKDIPIDLLDDIIKKVRIIESKIIFESLIEALEEYPLPVTIKKEQIMWVVIELLKSIGERISFEIKAMDQSEFINYLKEL